LSGIKKYSNGSWVDASIKKRSGSSWVNGGAFKRKNGQWVNIATQRYTETWHSTWTQTYGENDSKRTDYRANMVCQGKYDNIWGIQKSLVGFNNTFQSKLSGAKIVKVEVYLQAEHWYYTTGGKVVIGAHNHASTPAKFSHSWYHAKSEDFSARGQGKWIEMPLSFGEALRDGKYKGFSVFVKSANYTYYGVFYGASNGASYKPKIKITYEK